MLLGRRSSGNENSNTGREINPPAGAADPNTSLHLASAGNQIRAHHQFIKPMSRSKPVLVGLVTVYGPSILFVFGCAIMGYWAAASLFNSEIPEIAAMFSAFIAAPVGWIWWSYQIVKWKCWAFSTVTEKDAQVLFDRAIKVGLIWPNGSIFNKTEIWTQRDKEKWKKIDPEVTSLFYHPLIL